MEQKIKGITISGMMKDALSINNSSKLSLQVLIATLFSGFLSYYLLIINGYTNPDGICEGLTYYTSGDWALAGCGRWAIRYMNELTCNIVIPLYVVAMYCVCVWLSVVLLSKIWNFSNCSVIVMGIILIATPVVTDQLSYTYTALAYAFSCLLSVVCVYCVINRGIISGTVGALVSVCLIMGLYQSYVGMVAVLMLMAIVMEIIDGQSAKVILVQIVQCVIASLGGCLISTKILEWDLQRRGLDNSGTRVAEFSVSAIFESFQERFEYVYMKWSNFIKDTLMHRNILYIAIICITVTAILFCLYQLIRDKKYVRPVLIIGLVALIPFASNIIGILIPYNGVSNLMQYQNIMIVPFMFACLGKLKERKLYPIMQCGGIVVVFVLAWTYILGANATYKCYELSYEHINSQMQIAVSRVYDLDDYVKDETPILIAGFPSDQVLRNNLDIYQYANIGQSIAFWHDMHGATQNRYLYFMDYFGIDAQRFSDDEYAAIINTEEFSKMPVWPDKGSVEMIDGFAVIKFTEEPPMP
mgnify:CR=1 FL=1